MSIQKGDMVVVVRPATCCGDTTGIGMVYEVLDVIQDAVGNCHACGRELGPIAACIRKFDGKRPSGHELCRVVKLPPLRVPQDEFSEKSLLQ